MRVSILFHLVGMVMWAGGFLVTTRILASFVKRGVSVAAAPALTKSFLAFVWGGTALSLLTGLFQLFFGGVGTYMAQGWMHQKLTFVLGLLVLNLLAHQAMIRFERGEPVTMKRINIIHGLGGLCVLLIVGSVILFR